MIANEGSHFFNAKYDYCISLKFNKVIQEGTEQYLHG